MKKLILKYKFHILAALVVVGIGYFVFIQGSANKDLSAEDFICPEKDVDIDFTMTYMSKSDVNGVFKILDFLKSQGCDIALEKIQARMASDIESGKNPGGPRP